MTQEEAEAAIEDIKRLALRFKPLFARGDAADPDPDTHIQLYKDVNVTDADVEQFIVDANNGQCVCQILSLPSGLRASFGRYRAT